MTPCTMIEPAILWLLIQCSTNWVKRTYSVILHAFDSEIGTAILEYHAFSSSVRMKRELVPVGTMRSIQELLNDKRCLSVNIVTTVSKQLADYLRLLHESFLAIDQISETNIYIKVDKTKVLIYLFYTYIKTLYEEYQLCKNHYMK
jgi:hypothetical protein